MWHLHASGCHSEHEGRRHPPKLVRDPFKQAVGENVKTAFGMGGARAKGLENEK
jgi:hypothetical protein